MRQALLQTTQQLPCTIVLIEVLDMLAAASYV